MPINQPSNQIRLTNVSLVRLKKAKIRFEIACYKNKVLEYRSGQETDLDNVLQIHNVFLSVSKGQTAPSADLNKAFGKDHKLDDVIQEILKKGEMQVGDKERGAQKERLEKEVVDIIVGKVIDPRSKRVYTAGIIAKALEQLSSQSAHRAPETADHPRDSPYVPDQTQVAAKPIWAGIVTTKSAKSQALDAIKALIAWQIVPLARARMRLRVTCPTNLLKQGVKQASSTSVAEETTEKPSHPLQLKDTILQLFEQIESQDVAGPEWQAIGFAEPGALRALNDLLSLQTKGRATVDVLDTAITGEEEQA